MKTKQIPTYTILRFKQDDKATLGNWMDKQLKICSTIEPPWLNNQRDNPKTKENEASCIPQGKYLCKKFNGKVYKDVWEITGVSAREAVLIHNGNYAMQSKACILVGDKHVSHDGIPLVNNSVNTLNKLRVILPDEFYLDIKCEGFTNYASSQKKILLIKET